MDHVDIFGARNLVPSVHRFNHMRNNGNSELSAGHLDYALGDIRRRCLRGAGLIVALTFWFTVTRPSLERRRLGGK